MLPLSSSQGIIRFGDFDVDLCSGELRKHGVRIKLQVQPFRVLQILLEHPGEVVTREELEKRIWLAGTFVDFDQGLNNAVKKLREALGDNAEKPRFIETLSKRGYRFIGSLHNGATAAALREVAASATFTETSAPETRRRVFVLGLVLGAAVVAALVLVVGFNIAGMRDRLLGKSIAPRIQSLAVLPLQNLSADPAQEYFSDGMTDALITDLAQIGSLRVISRTSVMRYKKSDKSLPEIARELNVDGIVEGTVQRSGDRVRITAQLIQASTDKQLWANSYDRDVRDVLALQDDVARAIAGQVSVELADQRPWGEKRLVDPETEDTYLQGRYYLNQMTPEGLAKSLSYFEQAAQKDPNFAPAYADMAEARLRMVMFLGVRPGKILSLVKETAEKARQLDDTLAEPHDSIGFFNAFYDRNWPGAEAEFKRAIELNPGDSEAHSLRALFLLTPLGRRGEAIAEARQAVQLDPLSPLTNHILGYVLFAARQYDAAIEQYKQTAGLLPNLETTHWELMRVYETKGTNREAVTEFQEAAKLAGRDSRFVASIGRAYESSGVPGYWQKRVELMESTIKEGDRYYTELAFAYAGRGDKERALHYLEKGIGDRDDPTSYLINVDPGLDSLRSDPRFADLVRRARLPQ